MICREGKRGIEEEEEGESDGEQGWGRVVVGRDTAVQWLYNIWESSQSIFTKRKIITLFRLSTQKTRNLLRRHQVIMPSADLRGEMFPNLLNLKDFPRQRIIASASGSDLTMRQQCNISYMLSMRPQ